MAYVDFRSEVVTRPALMRCLAAGRRFVVPYCQDGRLGLFPIESWSELQPGAFQILEPAAELRRLPTKQLTPTELDLIFVPGLCYDLHGARLGYGLGHYDRLLAEVRPDCILVGLCFDDLLVQRLPSEPHDVAMNYIATESKIQPTREP